MKRGPQAGHRPWPVVDAVGRGRSSRRVLDRLGAEALHHPDARERLLDHAPTRRPALLEVGRRPGGAAVEKRVAATLRNGRAASDTSASLALIEKSTTATPSDHHHVGAATGMKTRNSWICWRSVLARAIELPGLGLVVVTEVEALQVGEQPAAQLGLGPQRDEEGGVAPDGRAPADDDGRRRRSATAHFTSTPRPYGRCRGRWPAGRAAGSTTLATVHSRAANTPTTIHAAAGPEGASHHAPPPSPHLTGRRSVLVDDVCHYLGS